MRLAGGDPKDGRDKRASEFLRIPVLLLGAGGEAGASHALAQSTLFQSFLGGAAGLAAFEDVLL
jgi:hypothetical protein